MIAECNNLVEETIKAFGGLDVIIGNAVRIISQPCATHCLIHFLMRYLTFLILFIEFSMYLESFVLLGPNASSKLNQYSSHPAMLDAIHIQNKRTKTDKKTGKMKTTYVQYADSSFFHTGMDKILTLRRSGRSNRRRMGQSTFSPYLSLFHSSLRSIHLKGARKRPINQSILTSLPKTVLGRQRQRPNGASTRCSAHLQRKCRGRSHGHYQQRGRHQPWRQLHGVQRHQVCAAASDAVLGADTGA